MGSMGRCYECKQCDGYACSKIDMWLDGTITFEDTNEKISVIEYGDKCCKDFEKVDTKAEKTMQHEQDEKHSDNDVDIKAEIIRRLDRIEKRIDEIEKSLYGDMFDHA